MPESTDQPSALDGLAYRILETAPEGVWVIDANSITTYANSAMADMLGYEREEMTGRTLFDFMDEEGKRIAQRNVERRRAGLSEAHEFVFRRQNGDELWTKITTSPLQNVDGGYAGAFAFVTNITEERERERERAQLWRIVDESLDEIYLFRETDLRFEYVNRGALHNLGYSLDEMVEMTPVDVKPTQTLESFRALLSPLQEGTKAKVVFESSHLRRNGSTYPVEVHVQIVRREPQRLFLAIVNDISDRLAAEQKLRAREARFRALIENNLDVLLLADENSRLTFASPSISRLLGYTPEELLEFEPLDLVIPEDRAVAAAALGRVMDSGETPRVDLRLKHKDGSLRTVSAAGRNLLDNPAVRGLVFNGRDVTDERKLEAQLQQSQRLESIGRLAGGIAHDFNNLLTAISGNVAFLRSNPSLDEEAAADVADIGKTAEKAAQLTKQLLAFARRGFVRPQHLNLGEVIASQARLLSRLLGEHIELTTQIADDLSTVFMDPTQAEQIVMNLAVNAGDAMTSGGRLILEARNTTLGAAFVEDRPGMHPGDYVLVAVRDTGEGIATEHLDHVFEPFFTTKPVGAGTGLGLSTVYGIVKQTGGHIFVDSAVDVGTTFEIYLPASLESAARTDQAEDDRVAQAGTGERLLVVEDDDGVRRAMVRTLKSAGYRVHAESDPAGALRWWRARGTERVALVVTDVVMPGMSGVDLVEVLRRSDPELLVLFVSGYTDNSVVRRGVLGEDIELLAKPFDPGELQKRVADMLQDRKR